MSVEQVEPRSLAQLCSLLGYSRQAYYQGNQANEKQILGSELIIQEVMHIRTSQKRVGVRKMLKMMDDFLDQHTLTIGRDNLFDLLRENGLLVRKRRSKKPNTTWSRHWFKRYPNLIKGFIPHQPNRLWVSDITYVVIGDNFGYLSLITDAYSRKIVGFYLSDNLSAYGCVRALKIALQNNPNREKLIHHSDRGAQYCSAEYSGILKREGILISMTQSGDPLENALAERVNGILKEELLESNYASFEAAQKSVAAAIITYNYQRLHLSIDMLTPEQAHHLEGEIKKHWKNYYQKRKEALPMTA
ncbi:MAG: IS3 family transposase [Chitinophagales bacterium]|nr:IS3 family transposase [Chitinophagales bacterium]